MIEVKFGRSHVTDPKGRAAYWVFTKTEDATQWTTAGYLTKHVGLDGRSYWIIRDPDDELLVSAGDGIGRGACTTRDEACTVLDWKLNKVASR